MKITRVRATPVNVPLEAAYVWSYGALPGFTQTIIEVETDEGLTGIGEALTAAAADADPASAIALADAVRNAASDDVGSSHAYSVATACIMEPAPVTARMKNYCGSVAADRAGRTACVTAPRGNIWMF